MLVDGQFQLTEEVREILSRPRLWIELLFPISYGRRWEYPYPQAQSLVRQLYETFGADKLVWGSDLPNVERYCTYRQSLEYLRRYCDFIPPAEMDLILGGNLATVFDLTECAPTSDG
jgi:predicted TIM-barrel fold metal-dependent hydrolase